jgi:hypothetical protein
MKYIVIGAAWLVLSLAGCKNAEKSTADNTPVETAPQEPSRKTLTQPIGPAKVIKPNQAPAPEQSTDQMNAEGEHGSDSGKMTTQKAPVIAEDLFFGMYTSPCFGNCPVFNLDVDITGHAVLEGKKFFDFIGWYECQLSEGQMQRIIDLADQYGYFTLEHSYDNPNVTDLPSILTILRTDAGAHWVYDRMNAPESLRSFEQELEVLVKEWMWKPMPKEDQK